MGDDGEAGVGWKKRHKRILIYGASSGYGAAIAKAYASKGHCMLTLVGRNISKLQKVEQECRAAGAFDVVVMTTDVTDYAQSKSLTEEALTTFGGLEMVVYAVVAPPPPEKLADTNDVSKVLKECFNSNYFGCIWAYQAAAPLLKRYKGHFVCITSIAAEMSTPGMSILSAATHAIHGFMDGAIKENPGFDITLVCSPPVHSGQGQAAPSDDSKISSLPLNQALNFLMEAVEKKKKKAFLGAMGIFSDSPSLLMQASHKDGMTKARNMLYKAPPCREMKANGTCPRGSSCPFSHDSE